MANLKTLKPFGKGHDPRRNLKGRPKGKVSSFDAILERELKKPVVLPGGKVVSMDVAITLRVMMDAYKGKLSATKLIFNYLYGKPVNYCPRCDYIASRRARKEIADMEAAERREEEERKERIRIEKEAKKIDEWIEGWLPKNKKKK